MGSIWLRGRRCIPSRSRGCKEGPVIIECEPNDILPAGRGIPLWRIFREAVCRDNAAAFRFKGSAPVRGRGITNVSHWRTTKLGWRRHAPTHHGQLPFGASVADDGSRVIGEDPRHWRQTRGGLSVGHNRPCVIVFCRRVFRRRSSFRLFRGRPCCTASPEQSLLTHRPPQSWPNPSVSWSDPV